MLFNSLPFILGFLPLTLAGYWLLAGHAAARLWFLLAASLLFYGYWDWRFEPLLVGSILGNWLAISAFQRYGHPGIPVAPIPANPPCPRAFKDFGFFARI